MTDSITRLFQAAQACRHDDPSTSRTARLLRSGRSKMAKKLAEEAVEVVIDAMNGDRDAVVKESADLIYNVVVLWISSGIRPEDVWREMDRRERLLGIAEKVPKKVLDDSTRRQRTREIAAAVSEHTRWKVARPSHLGESPDRTAERGHQRPGGVQPQIYEAVKLHFALLADYLQDR